MCTRQICALALLLQACVLSGYKYEPSDGGASSAERSSGGATHQGRESFAAMGGVVLASSAGGSPTSSLSSFSSTAAAWAGGASQLGVLSASSTGGSLLVPQGGNTADAQGGSESQTYSSFAGSSSGGQSTGAGQGGATGSKSSFGVGCTGGLEHAESDGVCVAKLVEVGAVNAKTKIDATEVTRGQFESWLGSARDISSLPVPSTCTSFPRVLSTFGPYYSCIGERYEGLDYDRHPMTCIDWCDAAVYCLAIGKRLCGNPNGGSSLYNASAHADPKLSQWYLACSSGGINKYPYGTENRASACNDRSAETTRTTVVASMPDCASTVDGYSGVYDLVGNVEEWEDSCDSEDSLGDWCATRGGSYGEGTDYANCSAVDSWRRVSESYVSPKLGFRCCGR